MQNQSKDGVRELRVLSACSMNSQSLPRFSRINSLKKGKSGKIWHDNVYYIPLAGWILRIYPCSLKFTEKNRSKDGIWELRILSTCSMNSLSLPCFSWINSLKKGKSGKIWHDNVYYIPLAGWILRIYPCSLKFTEKNRSKDGIWELRILSTCSMNS